MRNPLTILVTGLLLLDTAGAAQVETFDYFEPNRELIRRGVQAVLTCNGLFTSGRTVEQVFEQELAYLEDPIGTPHGGDWTRDDDLQAVAIGSASNPPVVRAAFREGLGCIVLAPDQTWEDIDMLPELDLPPAAGDPATLPWPDGDLVERRSLPA